MVILVLRNLGINWVKIEKYWTLLRPVEIWMFNHKRNHYFVNSTEKRDRIQVIPLITGIFLLEFLQIYGKCKKSLDFSSWFYDVHVQLSKLLDQYLVQLGKYVTGELLCTLILIKPCRFSPVGPIRILSIPTVCLLPDLICIVLPQRTSKDPELLFLPSFPVFSWFRLIGTLRGVKRDYHVILTFPYTRLHLFLSDPLGLKSVCRNFMLICHLSTVRLLYGYGKPTTQFF